LIRKTAIDISSESVDTELTITKMLLLGAVFKDWLSHKRIL
jgi:hypothetical protein